MRALSEHQAHGREGATVKPEEEAVAAGLRPGSYLYRAAVWWLLDNDALVPRLRRCVLPLYWSSLFEQLLKELGEGLGT